MLEAQTQLSNTQRERERSLQQAEDLQSHLCQLKVPQEILNVSLVQHLQVACCFVKLKKNAYKNWGSRFRLEGISG